MPITLQVNGQGKSLDIDPETPLLWALRDWLGLTGTKYGCGIGECGACTVHIDGQAQRSCQIALKDVGEKPVTTIEGLTPDSSHPVQKAWIALDVPQCGYCQSGMIMAVTALIKEKPKPTERDVEERITNICRCGTYPRVRAAIQEAAKSAA